MINAGRVLIIPKGEWTNLESYEMLDLVTRGDIAYIARQASVGVDPATDTQLTYWQPFGTAAKIATTTTPGLVMPDGTTVTIDATGLISANIGISDIKNVTITSISNGQILQYNSSTQKWENKSLGSAASRNATSSITSGSTDLIESGAVNSLKQTLENDIGDIETAIANNVLYFTSQACSALTGDFCTISNAIITANHVVAEVVFANPKAITTNVTWTTASGSLKLNGTCSTATTVNIVLVKKTN